ncbi:MULTISPECIES: hydrogenase maturation nickel metallochaperone HypA [Parafrankia]|uniref:Hydrogenase maturation factor HypA n=1 Tax=Parafrankia soli TaxID=2599596 RepID=A0A1S1Q151_9ACTN|nr:MULTISPECIES: hydrogenase maturation nickel metallochaperone HypA [Parafrankia]OHV27700.1 hydrogenase nickel incorporation protein HypA [Parafrankia soli]TCJ33847.1 hydrogenase maturation nickel metallochaperone HypA [Parafrankia sp. BMG5.11]CAI7980763.1 Hydrogenase maturation factor HypA [Frankia sp. Hr75.2]SQE00890.1 Hydrogenase nickel incorporation protein HypA [Parafrankia sp. Ea1.12]
MHELSVTVELVDMVARRVPADVQVTRVALEIGRLSGVMTSPLRFCFDLVAAGTSLDGARLDIAEPPGRGRCRRCGADVDLPDLLTPCGCGSHEIELTGGEEVRITAVEVR